jgi:predicted  nucleic acid-binding Zn-ribbon protein
MIAIGAVLTVIAIGGIFYAINASQIKPEEIKAEMAKEIKDMEKLKDKPVELDAEVERFLSKYEPVKKHVMSIYAKIEKDHGPVHSAADKLREANKAVQPFFNKFAAAKAGKPEEFKAQVQVLYDECRSLAESHGMTVHGEKLREMQAELMAILANAGPGWETSIIPLQGEVKAHAKKGEFAQAAAKIKEFGEKFNEKENVQLFNKLKGEREYLDRESPRFVDREFSKGQKEVADGSLKKDDFKKKLEGFRAGLEGYKPALDKLENHILTVK